jgi:hypothetical protein
MTRLARIFRPAPSISSFNGRLTPAAETLIARAGERVIARQIDSI